MDSEQQLSCEQRAIIDAVKLGYNVCVNSLAGCGKSTVIYALAQEQPQVPVLLLTYSKALKKESRKIAKNLSLKNLVVHTFHSAFQAQNDRQLSAALEGPSPNDFGHIGILVVDEMQDCNDILWKAIIRVRQRIGGPHTMLLLGDVFQCIYYSLTNSTPAYIMDPEYYFKTEFIHKRLTVSYRITHEIADFVNKKIMNFGRIREHYPGSVDDVILKNLEGKWGLGIQATRNGPAVNINVCSKKGAPEHTLLQSIQDWEMDRQGSTVVISQSVNYGLGFSISCATSKNLIWRVGDEAFKNTRDGPSLQTVYGMKGRECMNVINTTFDANSESFGNPLLAMFHQYTIATRASHRLVVIQQGSVPFFSIRDYPFTVRSARARDTTKNVTDYVPHNKKTDANLIRILIHRLQAGTMNEPTGGDTHKIYHRAIVKEVLKRFLAGPEAQASNNSKMHEYWRTRIESTNLHFNKRSALLSCDDAMTCVGEWCETVVNRCITLLNRVPFAWWEFRIPEVGLLALDTLSAQTDIEHNLLHCTLLISLDPKRCSWEEGHEVAALAGVIQNNSKSASMRAFAVNPVIGTVHEIKMASGDFTNHAMNLLLFKTWQRQIGRKFVI